MVRFFLLAVIVLQLVFVSLQTEDPELKFSIRLGDTSQANVNDQINTEYKAMYLYEAMMSYFGRPSVGLPGFKKFFKKSADEERKNVHKLIDYLNKRGGKVQLKSIIPPKPENEWNSPLDATKQALEVEMDVTNSLYTLRDQADAEKDTQLVDFIESEFLTEQINGISELRELISKLMRAGTGLGEYMVDRELN